MIGWGYALNKTIYADKNKKELKMPGITGMINEQGIESEIDLLNAFRKGEGRLLDLKDK